MLIMLARIGTFVALILLSISAYPSTVTPGNGTCWTFLSLPGGEVNSTVKAVKAFAAADVWAVGSYPSAIAHFDGAKWAAVAQPLSVYPHMQSIDGVAPDDIWAVGFYTVDAGGGNTTSMPLTLHWDGHVWKEITGPRFNELTELYGVLALAADDVWAVGVHFDAPPRGKVLIEHWDGRQWSLAPGVDNLGDLGINWQTSGLRSVAGARNDLWAVGLNVVLHWDGTNWRVANSFDKYSQLLSVAVDRAGEVWVVGATYGSAVRLDYWDKHTWRTMLSPATGAGGRLLAVAADSAGNIWAAGDKPNGYTSNSSTTPILLHATSSDIDLVGDAPIAALTMSRFDAVDIAPNGDVWIAGSNPAFIRYAASCGLPAPASPAQTFAETRYSVWGPFLDYWQDHGALEQLGYPLSAQLNEISDMDGKPYTVQYFERAILELHPLSNTPDNVQVLPLGKMQYAQKYPGSAPGQKINKQNSRYFPATGHYIGGEFRDYWESHGGLTQQGAPLSDEFLETSPLDGQQYTVQYFERAVFEQHPQNTQAYQVLLSHLGFFRGRDKYPFSFPIDGP